MTDRTRMKERRDARQHALGIDCVDRLTWKDWAPGSEYTRKILVKNVDRGSQTIQLSLPTHKKIFITPFPEPITLSSGVSHEIAISFRPVEMVELHDAVTIAVEGRGSFQVRLDCLTPYAKLSMPSSYDFDYCAVGDTSHAEVQLRNTGTAPVEFTWETPAPFCILPKHAVLDQGESMHLTLLFSPTDACTMVGQAVCRLTGVDEVIATLKVSGIGKFPFIAFQDQQESSSGGGGTCVVKMEAKMSGPLVTREVRIANPSAVPATVRLRRCDDSLGSPFKVVVDGVSTSDSTAAAASGSDRFVIPRGSTQTLRLQYTPSSPDVLLSAVFQVDCVEGNTLLLELSGTTAGPRVTTSAASIDFNVVDLEHAPTAKQRTRHLTLRNTSAVDAPFAWANTLPGAAFVVHPHCGVVPAQSSQQVAVMFQPTQPILYYRRLHLVVEGMADAVCVDVFGGAYNSAIRPPTLTPADVEAALLRCERGLGLLTPEALENIAAAAAAEDAGGAVHVAARADHHHHRVSQPTTSHQPVAPATLETWRRIEEDTRGSGVVMRGAKQRRRVPLSSLEAVSGRVAVDNPFGIDAQQLYTFVPRGGGPAGAGSSNIHNAGGDGRGQSVTIMNTADVPAVATWILSGASCPYSVTPTQQTIAPHGSAIFQLQCGSIGADGGSSGTSAADAAALCTLECYVNFESMSAFYLAPEGCVVPPRCFTVTCTTPLAPTAAASALAKQAQARTGASQQQLQQQLVCLPACRLGAASYQIIALHNRGHTPVRYEVTAVLLKQVSAVVLPPDITRADTSAAAQEADVDGSAFSVMPPVGVVLPQSRQLLVVCFRPSEAARYEATASVSWRANERGVDAANGGGGGGGVASSPSELIPLSLLGEVCLPQLQWRTACDTVAEDVTFAPTCVTGEARQLACVRNPTALPVAFRFDTTTGLVGVLRMEPEWAVVPGGARMPVTLFFSPQHPRAFAGSLQVHLEDGATDAPDRQLYRQQLPFFGEGAYAEVEVEPRVIDVGEAPDAEEQQATLTLYNSGVCDVQYDVRAMRVAAVEQQEFTSPPPSSSSPAVVVPRLHNHRGVLPARTHTTVLVAAQPTPGLTEFVVYAVVSGLATDLDEVPDAASVQEAERHPHCRWSLRAAHPAVQIVNVHFPGVARPLAWQQLNLNAVNAQLAAAGGDAGCDADAFSFEHYVGGLAPITMDLGVTHENTTTAAFVTVSLQNTGDCPAPFSLMLPTQHDANTEHWCLENTELADLQYIVDHGIIAVAPSQGVINVGETVQLRIVYTHSEVGVHRLPMLLRVGAGERRVAVVLEGRTLPHDVQVLNFHHDRVFKLLPVALGDMEPPLQYVTVSNPSSEPVEYSVDVAALQAHADANYGFPIFQCSDPQGVVGPHATASIGFYFRPLEARRYIITALVQTAKGESYYVDLVGDGYHPRETAKSSVARWVDRAMMHLPSTPQSGPLRVVSDVCTLGAVPYYTLCRRTCVLQLAPDAPTAMRYVWQAEHQAQHGDAHLSLHPAEGVLQPGEQHTVQLSFYAGSTSQVLAHLVRCTVAPSTPVPNKGRLSPASTRHGQRVGGRPSQQKSDTFSMGGGSTEWVGVLVQARVMPREDYEVLYGAARLAASYMPALYVDPVSPASIAAPVSSAAVGKDEARFVSSLVDEILSSVIASPSVQESFTTLCPPRTASYAKMRALHNSASDSEAAAAAERRTAPVAAKGGDLAAAVLTEGVLEELLRGILSESIAAA